jgi:hypothetical protein
MQHDGIIQRESFDTIACNGVRMTVAILKLARERERIEKLRLPDRPTFNAEGSLIIDELDALSVIMDGLLDDLARMGEIVACVEGAA